MQREWSYYGTVVAHKKEVALPVCCTEHAWSQKTSPVQRSPTGCVCLFVYDLETSAMRVPKPILDYCAKESKARSEFHPRRGHEVSEGEYMYSFTLS
jgi:hypothetical protein